MAKVDIKIAEETRQRLGPLAAEAGLSVDKLAEVLLDSFVRNNGKVFVGAWREGPGIRIMPDWPRFSSGVIKLKKEEMG